MPRWNITRMSLTYEFYKYNHAYTRNRRLAEERSRDREDALVAAAMRFQRDNQHHVPKYVWVNMG